MFLLVAFLTLAPTQKQAAEIPLRPDFQIVERPTNSTSIMVSEAYAEIGWNASPGATAYKIQIRKIGFDHNSTLQIDQKTCWTSFYFRLADPDATYEFRLAALENDQQSGWTDWTNLTTKPAGLATKN